MEFDSWTRDWQTFWGIFMSSFILILAFKAVRGSTALSNNKLYQVFAIYWIIEGIKSMNILFGPIGFNPALASGYIFFETTQFNFPNPDFPSKALSHYLWAYFVGPIAGACLAGFVFWIHEQTHEGEVRGIKIRLTRDDGDSSRSSSESSTKRGGSVHDDTKGGKKQQQNE